MGETETFTSTTTWSTSHVAFSYCVLEQPRTTLTSPSYSPSWELQLLTPTPNYPFTPPLTASLDPIQCHHLSHHTLYQRIEKVYMKRINQHLTFCFVNIIMY